MIKAAERVFYWALRPWQQLKNRFKARRSKNVKNKKNNEIITELMALLLISLALIVFISLISYEQQDNTLLIGKQEFSNKLGPLGAIIAGSLFKYFGVFATLVPLGFFYALNLLLKKFTIETGRVLGLLAIVIGFVPLLSQWWPGELRFGFSITGTSGVYLKEFFLFYSGVAGLYIANLVLCLGGLLYVLNRPYLIDGFKRSTHLMHRLLVRERAYLRKEKVTEPKEDIKEDIIVLEPVLDNSLSKPANDEFKDIQIIKRDQEASLTAVKKAEQDITTPIFSFSLPPLKLLDFDAPSYSSIDPKELKQEAEKLQRAFLQFGIEGKIREIRPGPVVTNYEFVPAPGIKLSRIAALSDDIAMAMSAVQVRIVTPIPGKGAVGIEVPNAKRETVYLKEIVADERYRKEPHKLCMAIGKDVEGNPYFMNLADMPHVLIAGTTGSGKSVSVNAMICSILYRATPEEVRFLFIDPKMLELSIYNGIPHLLLPPIIDSKKAGNALRWAVKEMEERYALMKEAAVRDIATYNEKIKKDSSLKPVGNRNHEHLPFIVIVVDEYADLLSVAGKEVESHVMRLAQKARAAGIHVMLATQRPSVDVITGVIKANFPVRMGFRLASSHDSKTIVNKTGAEKLLGRGDVLIMPPGTSDLYRVHGAFVSEKELARVIDFWQSQKPPVYKEEIADFAEEDNSQESEDLNEKSDEKYEEAKAIVQRYQRCSTSFIQRQLSIGYNRAARIVELMEKNGVVGPVLNAKGEREIFLEEI